MSLDLKLLFVRDHTGMINNRLYCFDVLAFATDSYLFGQIIDLSKYVEYSPSIAPRPLPDGCMVYHHRDDGLRFTKNDDYGTPLTFVYAKELSALKCTEDTPPYNRAVVAFVKALPPETPIILMWC